MREIKRGGEERGGEGRERSELNREEGAYTYLLRCSAHTRNAGTHRID
jgi:hypothetical protein